MSAFDSIVLPIKTGSLGALTVGEKYTVNIPFDYEVLEISSVAASVAPTGSTAILDVEINGTSIFATAANKPTIAISGTALVTGDIDGDAVGSAGQILSVDVDQVGSTVAGTMGEVYVWVKRR